MNHNVFISFCIHIMQPKSYMNCPGKPKLMDLQCNIVRSHNATNWMRVCGKKAPQPLPLQIPSWAHLSQVWAVWIRCWDGVISGGTTGGAACIIQAWIGRESHTRQDRLPLWIRSISQPLSPPAIIHKNTIWTYSNVAFTYNLLFFLSVVKLSYTMTKPGPWLILHYGGFNNPSGSLAGAAEIRIWNICDAC